jgi:hypothetical protein
VLFRSGTPLNTGQLFDIVFNLQNYEIKKSSELTSVVTFTSFGNGSTPINLTFIVLDSDGNQVYNGKTNLSVATEWVLIWDYKNIKDLPSGTYTALLDTLYNTNVFDEFRQDFEIKKQGIDRATIAEIVIAALLFGWLLYKAIRKIRRYIRRKKREEHAKRKKRKGRR